MQLSPGRFNAFLRGIGQQFMWRRSFVCPNVNPASGAHIPNCQVCGNKPGILWNDEVQGVAGMTSKVSRRVVAQVGIWEPGDAILTIGSDSPLYAMGKFDRVRMLNSTVPFSLILIRGQNDRLPFKVVSFARAFWVTGQSPSQTLVEGGLPTVDDSGNLTWASNGPPNGQSYSLTGVKFDEHFCFQDLPSDRAEHSGAALPKRVHLRKFDLFSR